MVVDQISGADVDRIFHALADGTRRDILAHAFGSRCSVSALAKRYPMSFAAVQKHVAVLEGAGLVTKQRRGREQLVLTDVDTVGRSGRSWTASRGCGGRGWIGSTTSWQPRSELLETTDERDQSRKGPQSPDHDGHGGT
jgi:DNA-binding transcriptional ArsR family regulator